MENLSKRRPEIAQHVKAAIESGVTLNRSVSFVELSQTNGEKDPLLEKSPTPYGAPDSFNVPVGQPIERSDSMRSIVSGGSDSVTNLAGGAIEMFKGYLRGNFAIKLAETMNYKDVQIRKFSQCLYGEVSIHFTCH